MFFVVYNISLKRLYPNVPYLKWQVLKTVYAFLLPYEDLVISTGVWSDILGSSYFPFLFEILLHFQSDNKIAVSKGRKCRRLCCWVFFSCVSNLNFNFIIVYVVIPIVMEIWKIHSEEFENIKGVIRTRKSKTNRHHNGVGIMCPFQCTNRSQSISPNFLQVYVFYLYTFSIVQVLSSFFKCFHFG